MRDTSGISTRLVRTIWILLEVTAGDQVSLSSCHSDTEIPINFQEESGIITF